MEDLITIIIPIYNAEKYLRKCLDSIMNQTHKSIEVLLINDGSRDNSGKICDEYEKKDERIKVIHKENEGVSVARNIGLKNAKGEYIAFIDADDYVEKEYLEKLLRKLKDHNVECIICGYNRIYGNSIEKISKDKSYTLSKIEFLDGILNVQGGIGFTWGKLWKKQAIKNIEFKKEVKIGEDSLFCIEASKNVNNVYILNETLYNYVFNENSAVRKYNENFANYCLISMQEAKKVIETEYKENKEIIEKFNNYIAYHILLIAVNYCFNKENNLNFIKQIKQMKEIVNIREFKCGVKNSNYEGLTLTRKVTLFTIKYKLYFITMIIARIRQMQFKRSKRC